MDLSQIHSHILSIKKTKSPAYTNFYTQKNITYEVKILPHSIIMLQRQKGFWRLYFFTTKLEELQSTLETIHNKIPICIEILQKQEQIIFKSINKQAIYTRLKKSLHKEPQTTRPKQLSKKPSAMEFHHLIHKDFNPYFDHLPTISTIKNWLKNDAIIYILGEANQIISYLVYSTKGKGAYINYIANYGGKGTLLQIWEMFYQELNNFDIEFVHLWCDTQNTKAMNMYQIEGFLPDGLQNFIYLKTPKKFEVARVTKTAQKSQKSNGGGDRQTFLIPISLPKAA